MDNKKIKKNKQNKDTKNSVFSLWLKEKQVRFKDVEKNKQKIALGIQTPLKEIFNVSKIKKGLKDIYKIESNNKNLKIVSFLELNKAKLSKFVSLFNSATKKDFSIIDFVGYFNSGICVGILNRTGISDSLDYIKVSSEIVKDTNDIIYIKIGKNWNGVVLFDFLEEIGNLHRTILIHVGVGANVKTLNQNIRENNYCNCIIIAEKNSEIILTDIIFGEKEYLSHINTVAKIGAKIDIRNLYIGKKDSKADISVLSKSTGDLSCSKIKSYGIINESAHLLYRTGIDIKSNLKKVNGEQKAKFITLSEKAKVDAIPALDIASEDIKCSHSVSIDSIHDMEVYYPMLRGLNKKQSKTLVLQSFFKDIFEEFPSEQIKVLSDKISKYIK